MEKQNETPLTERKVLRRGLLAGLGVGVLLKLTGAGKAEALDPNDVALNVDNTATLATRIVGNVTMSPALFGLRQDAPAGTAFFAVVQNSTTNIHGTAIMGLGGGMNPGSAAGTTGGIGVNASGGGNGPAGTTGGIGLNAVGGSGNGAATANGGAGIVATGGTGGSTGIQGVGIRATGGGALGNQASGVVGQNNSAVNAAIYGNNDGSGSGVHGRSGSGPGVQGNSVTSLGVRGLSTDFVGVVGISDASHGLYGSTSNPSASGLVGENLSGGVAGFFQGNVQIYGSLQVFGGPKNAVLKMQDGTFASVYCQESPEPFFEDFGRAQLVGGVANVPLEREFATLVAGGDYMVFCFPEGPASGLYVSRRSPTGFEVRDAAPSNISFTYRIVTRRKDIEGKRFARVNTDAAQNVAGARAVLAGMRNAGPSSGPASPLPPLQAVPPIGSTTPLVVPTGPGSTIVPPGAGPSSAPYP